jgi:hypothetical protein
MAPPKKQPYKHAAAAWREQQVVVGLEDALLSGLPARESAPVHIQVKHAHTHAHTHTYTHTHTSTKTRTNTHAHTDTNYTHSLSLTHTLLRLFIFFELKQGDSCGGWTGATFPCFLYDRHSHQVLGVMKFFACQGHYKSSIATSAPMLHYILP